MKRVLLGILGLGLFIGFVSSSYIIGKNSANNTQNNSASNQVEEKKYDLLAKRLFVDNPNDPKINFAPLREQIKSYSVNNNLVGSIYFEYLPTGTSIRVDGDNTLVGASLMKLPAAMEFYKAVELGKVNPDSEITLTKEMLDNNYGELYKKGEGYSLTLKEAARIMLEESDNTALKAVATSMDGKVPQDQSPFSYVDVTALQNPDDTISISARSYSSFIKCLYFSCYNSKQDSQEILESLTKTPFDDRIKAGIASTDIKVAHKIGSFAQDTQSDCGLVYYPNRNYVICIMLKGAETADTDRHIAEISKLAFEYVRSLE